MFGVVARVEPEDKSRQDVLSQSKTDTPSQPCGVYYSHMDLKQVHELYIGVGLCKPQAGVGPSPQSATDALSVPDTWLMYAQV